MNSLVHIRAHFVAAGEQRECKMLGLFRTLTLTHCALVMRIVLCSTEFPTFSTLSITASWALLEEFSGIVIIKCNKT